MDKIVVSESKTRTTVIVSLGIFGEEGENVEGVEEWGVI